MKTRMLIKWLVPLLAIALLLGVTQSAFAQDPQPPDLKKVAEAAADTTTSLNVIWLIAGMLVFLCKPASRWLKQDSPGKKRNAHHDDEHDGLLHRRVRVLAHRLRFSIWRRQLYLCR